MSLTDSGDIKYELKKAWSNGKTHVLLSPLELIEKLCALIPLPRLNLVGYLGVLAPNAKMREGVIPGKTRAQLKAEQLTLLKKHRRCLHLQRKLRSGSLSILFKVPGDLLLIFIASSMIL